MKTARPRSQRPSSELLRDSLGGARWAPNVVHAPGRLDYIILYHIILYHII